MSNQSKRKRTNFTGSQWRNRTSLRSRMWEDLIKKAFDNTLMANFVTEGASSRPKESTGSEDIGR